MASKELKKRTGIEIFTSIYKDKLLIDLPVFTGVVIDIIVDYLKPFSLKWEINKIIPKKATLDNASALWFPETSKKGKIKLENNLVNDGIWKRTVSRIEFNHQDSKTRGWIYGDTKEYNFCDSCSSILLQKDKDAEEVWHYLSGYCDTCNNCYKICKCGDDVFFE